jgi:hypothetical protein
LAFEEGVAKHMGKYIQHGAGGASLFDLAEDPAEELNLVLASPEAAAFGSGRMDQLLQGAAIAATPASDRATVEALEALGYLE